MFMWRALAPRLSVSYAIIAYETNHIYVSISPVLIHIFIILICFQQKPVPLHNSANKKNENWKKLKKYKNEK